VSCEERAPDIFLYAAGVLEGEEAQEMAAHLRGGCQRCEAEFAEAEARLSKLYASLDAVEPSDVVRARLLARVAEEPAASPARRGARSGWARLALAAGLAAAVAAGLTAALMDRFAAEPLRTEIARLESESDSLLAARQDLEERIAELQEMQAEQDSELADLEEALELHEQLAVLLRAPDLQVLALAAAGTQTGAWARIFWEWEDYSCYLHAMGLAAPPEGRVYVLWLLTEDGSWVRAGELALVGAGEANFFTRLPRDTGRVRRAQITLELPAEVDEPSGAVQLSGQLL